MMSSLRLFAFAIARREVVRGLSYQVLVSLVIRAFRVYRFEAEIRTYFERVELAERHLVEFEVGSTNGCVPSLAFARTLQYSLFFQVYVESPRKVVPAHQVSECFNKFSRARTMLKVRAWH